MLDKLNAEATGADFSADQLEIFSVAREAQGTLRKGFECLVAIGKAVRLARDFADAPGGNQKVRSARFRAVLVGQGLDRITGSRRNEASQILKVMGKLDEVRKWRSGLSEIQRIRWASAQSVLNRAPCFRPDGKIRGPDSLRAKPLSVSELMRMKSDDIALMLYRRSPTKMFAVMRSMEELAATGSAVKPVSGWAIGRKAQEPDKHAIGLA
jgi:hypothetical protein